MVLYIKNLQKVFFSDEAKTLNETTNKCFAICEKQNADIYAFALNILSMNKKMAGKKKYVHS